MCSEQKDRLLCILLGLDIRRPKYPRQVLEKEDLKKKKNYQTFRCIASRWIWIIGANEGLATILQGGDHRAIYWGQSGEVVQPPWNQNSIFYVVFWAPPDRPIFSDHISAQWENWTHAIPVTTLVEGTNSTHLVATCSPNRPPLEHLLGTTWWQPDHIFANRKTDTYTGLWAKD